MRPPEKHAPVCEAKELIIYPVEIGEVLKSIL